MQNAPLEDEMPIEVQQMMLDRMDEVQSKKQNNYPNTYEDGDLDVFKN